MIDQANVSPLKAAWEELKKTRPGIRIRDAADSIGCSEAELLATTLGKDTVRLEGDYAKLFSHLPELGRVMSLTRNDGCVLEHKGEFSDIQINGTFPHAMAVVTGSIETRVFFRYWRFGFAVKVSTPHGPQQSLQFFDASGTAITKIYLQGNGSHADAYSHIVEKFGSGDQSSQLVLQQIHDDSYLPVREIDRSSLLSEWGGLEDVHEYAGMLRRRRISRFDAVITARGNFTTEFDPAGLSSLLIGASQRRIPVMIFVGNRGNIQIHQAAINNVRRTEGWINVLDPDFNMHLREDHVHSAWIVRKPTSAGTLNSIEVFDAKRNLTMQMFGLSKPGSAEPQEWTALVDDLQRDHQPTQTEENTNRR